jgi:hypothetical protein
MYLIEERDIANLTMQGILNMRCIARPLWAMLISLQVITWQVCLLTFISERHTMF